MRIFTIREPVTPIDAPAVASALDHAADQIMTKIVAFAARTL